jgi:stage II sporulation protein P
VKVIHKVKIINIHLLGNYRTTDLNYSVARVGDELTNYLGNYGFNVNHNKNYHDYPAYTGSYTRSLATVQNSLKEFSSDIIIDLHRDAIGSDENYAPLVKIGDDYCAQLMFVMGTDGGGLSHSNWSSNLKFAVKIQEKANELYPGLFKPIILRNSRYNQHLGKAACIIEVGATGNTLEQTINSMKYLSKVMSEALK